MRTLRTLAPLGVAVLAIGATSCSTGGTASSPAALPMQQHWEAGNALQHAMVRGDLTAARRAAARIAEVEEIPGLTWDAGPYLTRMRTEAIAVRSATSFQQASEAAGRMGAACGMCHAHGDVGPRPETATTAPSVDEEDPEYHMIRHAWAMDRMWEGLVVPSVDRWRAGARVLAGQPLSAMGLTPEVSLLAARVHEMGRQALDDVDAEKRGERFGKILTDCAGCHAEMGMH